MTALLEARNLRKVFGAAGRPGGRTVAVDDVSLAIEEGAGSFVAIAGGSGSGKTTLARMLLGLAEPTRERGRPEPAVLHRGDDVHRMSARRRMEFLRDVQAVFQNPNDACNPCYPVDHLLMMPVAALGLATGAAARSLVEEALDAVGLDPGRTLGRRPRQLSAGQLQRVTLARALLVKPRLIVADEPVSMVDASLRASILGTIRRLHRERGISFLYITHDLATAFHVCERLLVMYRGCVVESGDVRTVIRDPRHPYTRSLVDAVPSPDPARPWGAAVRAPRPAGDLAAGPGCPYLVACDRAGPECVDERPALTVVQDGHEVACARAGVRAG